MARTFLIALGSLAFGAGLAASVWWVSRAATPTGHRPPPVPFTAAADEPPDDRETTDYEPADPTIRPSVEVDLVGQEDRWLVRRAGSPGTAGTVSVVHVPAESNVRLRLTSRDFVYMLTLPRINVSQIAVPGREFTLDFRSRAPGVFFLPGEHVCGPPIPTLTVAVHVEPKRGEPPQGSSR